MNTQMLHWCGSSRAAHTQLWLGKGSLAVLCSRLRFHCNADVLRSAQHRAHALQPRGRRRLQIAMKELRERVIPFIVRRYLPDGRHAPCFCSYASVPAELLSTHVHTSLQLVHSVQVACGAVHSTVHVSRCSDSYPCHFAQAPCLHETVVCLCGLLVVSSSTTCPVWRKLQMMSRCEYLQL